MILSCYYFFFSFQLINKMEESEKKAREQLKSKNLNVELLEKSLLMVDRTYDYLMIHTHSRALSENSIENRLHWLKYDWSNNRAINVLRRSYSTMAKQNDNESQSQKKRLIIIMIQWFRLSIIHFMCVCLILLLLLIWLLVAVLFGTFHNFSIYSTKCAHRHTHVAKSWHCYSNHWNLVVVEVVEVVVQCSAFFRK